MAHITLPDGVPGIRGPLMAYPATAEPIRALTEALMNGPSSLTPAEREVIAAYVSKGNECNFCARSHASTARHLLGERSGLVADVLADPSAAAIDEKLKALLAIADKVRRDGRLVTDEDVARAREAGADDKAIHDTVLVAAAFCMFNRYVDGLATYTPDDDRVYEESGAYRAANGYRAIPGT